MLQPLLTLGLFVHGLNGHRRDTWTKKLNASEMKRTRDDDSCTNNSLSRKQAFSTLGFVSKATTNDQIPEVFLDPGSSGINAAISLYLLTAPTGGLEISSPFIVRRQWTLALCRGLSMRLKGCVNAFFSF